MINQQPFPYWSMDELSENASLMEFRQFQIDPTGGQEVAVIQEWRTAQVPLPWQAQFEDLRHTSGVGWYQRTFTLDALLPGQVLIIAFGAADYLATVWINGRRVGEHEAAICPLSLM